MALFLFLSFVFSWAAWFAAIQFGVVGDVLPPVTAIASFGPALAAIWVSRSRESTDRSDERSQFRRVYLGLVVLTGVVFLLRVVTGGRTALGNPTPGSPGAITPTTLLIAGGVVLLAAWVFAAARSPDQGIRRRMYALLEWKVGGGYWIFALTVMPLVYLLGAGLTLSLGGELPVPALYRHEGAGGVGLLAVAFLYGALLGGGNEELGWRGFMLPTLQERLSPLAASLVIGVFWSLWHLPLHMGGFYEGGAMLGSQSVIASMSLRTVQTVPLAILFTWLYNRTDGNLLLMVVLHATVSLAAVVVPYTTLSLVPGTLLIVGLVIRDRMWRTLPQAAEGKPLPLGNVG